MNLRKAQSVIRRIQYRWKNFRYRINSTDFQRRHWAQELARYDWDQEKVYGYEWGDPERPDDRLGNYLAVKKRLLELLKGSRTAMEIGSLGGKWTQYMLQVPDIICVDINDLGFDYIRKKLPHDHIRFYLTKGNELDGIPDGSVDLIFSMDTFVRVAKKDIAAYFREMRRVLRPSGKFFVHLPCASKPECRGRLFTKLSLDEIMEFCNQSHFMNLNVDSGVIIHGVMVEGTKSF